MARTLSWTILCVFFFWDREAKCVRRCRYYCARHCMIVALELTVFESSFLLLLRLYISCVLFPVSRFWTTRYPLLPLPPSFFAVAMTKKLCWVMQDKKKNLFGKKWKVWMGFFGVGEKKERRMIAWDDWGVLHKSLPSSLSLSSPIQSEIEVQEWKTSLSPRRHSKWCRCSTRLWMYLLHFSRCNYY